MSGPRKDGTSQPVPPVVLLVAFGLPIAGYLAWALWQAGQVSLRWPWMLLLLGALVLAYRALFRQPERRRAAIEYSSISPLAGVRLGPIARLVHLPAALRWLAMALLIVGLARPQTRARDAAISVSGIDVVVALDLSHSMDASDLLPNRLEAAKRVLDGFIARRRSDRLGLVVFGKEAHTYCPLTLDYAVLRNLVAGLQLGFIDGTATAIGNALGLSLARLRPSDAKSRVVILLTDGDNNSGNLAPIEAARFAASMKVKVFTILVGARDGADRGRSALPGSGLFGQVFGRTPPPPTNPKLLEQVAATTGGRAFIATDRQALEGSFETILDELEKSVRRDKAAPLIDAYRVFLGLALGLLLLEGLLRATRWRTFP